MLPAPDFGLQVDMPFEFKSLSRAIRRAVRKTMLKPWLLLASVLLTSSWPETELLASPIPALGRPRVFCITDYGAVGDGKSLCTPAVDKAIAAAVAAGGGTVYFPPGRWLSGTLELNSHVTLHLAQGCTLLGSTNLNDYPEKIPALRSYTDNYTRRSLIYAEDLDDIAIEGAGTIDGNGSGFPRKHGPAADYLRPYLIRMSHCRDVRVEGVFLKNPAMWTQHYLACQRVRVTGVRVWGFANYNNDSLDIDGCQDVLVSKCFVASEDDGIVLKSTSERPCRAVTIENCVVSSRSSPIKLGTESMGGFQDITIANCAVRPVPPEAPHILTDGRNGLTGIELIIADGGHMERVNISNISIEGMQVPMAVLLNARGRGLEDPERLPEASKPKRLPVGSIKNISLSNIVASGAETNCGIMLLGLPGHPLENISLANITVCNAGGGEGKLAERLIPERAYDYPQAAWWGLMPGYGLYARHVRGLSVSNVRFQTAAPDARHALVLNDVQEADLNDIAGMLGTATSAILHLSGSKNVLIRGMRPRSPDGAFLKVDGTECGDIALVGNDFACVKQVIQQVGNVSAGAVREAGNINP